MEGEGVKDYLRDIGRDVASSLGEELKGVADCKSLQMRSTSPPSAAATRWPRNASSSVA